MNKNPYLDLNDKNDFGFTFSNEDEVISNTVYADLPAQVEDLRHRLQAIKAIYLPFLENLNRDPSKPMIKWENRKEVLDKQIEKLKQLTNI